MIPGSLLHVKVSNMNINNMDDLCLVILDMYSIFHCPFVLSFRNAMILVFQSGLMGQSFKKCLPLDQFFSPPWLIPSKTCRFKQEVFTGLFTVQRKQQRKANRSTKVLHWQYCSSSFVSIFSLELTPRVFSHRQEKELEMHVRLYSLSVKYIQMDRLRKQPAIYKAHLILGHDFVHSVFIILFNDIHDI